MEDNLRLDASCLVASVPSLVLEESAPPVEPGQGTPKLRESLFDNSDSFIEGEHHTPLVRQNTPEFAT